MKIIIKAKPNAKEAYVKKLNELSYEVAVKEPPVEGRANSAIIKTIAEHLGVSYLRVKIISGWTSRQKIIEIL